MTFPAAHSIEELMARKTGGHFRIEALGDRQLVTVCRIGQPEQSFVCFPPGHANQVRLALSDEGLVGFVTGAH